MYKRCNAIGLDANHKLRHCDMDCRMPSLSSTAWAHERNAPWARARSTLHTLGPFRVRSVTSTCSTHMKPYTRQILTRRKRVKRKQNASESQHKKEEITHAFKRIVTCVLHVRDTRVVHLNLFPVSQGRSGREQPRDSTRASGAGARCERVFGHHYLVAIGLLPGHVFGVFWVVRVVKRVWIGFADKRKGWGGKEGREGGGGGIGEVSRR